MLVHANEKHTSSSGQNPRIAADDEGCCRLLNLSDIKITYLPLQQIKQLRASGYKWGQIIIRQLRDIGVSRNDSPWQRFKNPGEPH